MSGRTLRASEIAEFIFCQRAWWYRRLGTPSANTGRLRSGTRWHREHGQSVLAANCLRVAGYLLLIAAAVVAAAYGASLLLG